MRLIRTSLNPCKNNTTRVIRNTRQFVNGNSALRIGVVFIIAIAKEQIIIIIKATALHTAAFYIIVTFFITKIDLGIDFQEIIFPCTNRIEINRINIHRLIFLNIAIRRKQQAIIRIDSKPTNIRELAAVREFHNILCQRLVNIACREHNHIRITMIGNRNKQISIIAVNITKMMAVRIFVNSLRGIF